MRKRGRPLSPGRRRFLKAGAAAAVTGLTASAYGYALEPDHPRVSHVAVKVPGWPVAAGLTVGHLGDFHCQSDAAVARTARAASLLLAQKPDIVFLTGDYTSNGDGPAWARSAAEALAPLRAAPRGVFCVLGNHDYPNGHPSESAAALAKAGFEVLLNRAAPFPGVENTWIVGMESLCLSYQNPVQAMEGVPKDAVKILLVHEPDYADEAPLGIGLQLSGHSHAGQVRIPGLPPLHCPAFGTRYPEGLQQAENHQVYTTRGVGMIGPQIRFCCPPEIVVLRISPA